jgi:hypothetical protein
MTPEEFNALYPKVLGWITSVLSDHKNDAAPIASAGFVRLPRYFSPELLAVTKFVAMDRVPVPPLSALGLNRFAAFEQGDYDGITYLDTFFLKRGRVTDEGLHFHELIHVVQWRLLGPERFIFIYAAGLETFGYRNSPLEKMAYDAQESFAQSTTIFDAEKMVGNQLRSIGALN